MFETLQKAFKVVEVRRKLIFTFLMLIVIRIGSQLPTPGVDPTNKPNNHCFQFSFSE